MTLLEQINAAKRNAAVGAVLKNLSQIGVDAEMNSHPNLVTLDAAVRGIVEKHGGVRAAASATGVDKSFISRLLNGKKTAPSDETLRKLGLHAAPMYALLQSAPQSPAVPELDPMNRLIVSDPKQPKPPQQATSVPKEWRDYVFAAADELRLTVRDLKNGFVRCGNCGEQETTSDLDCVSDIDGALELLDGLLQSAPATVAVTAEWREVIADLLANDGADGGRYDASKWLAARDKARALLQSAEVTK